MALARESVMSPADLVLVGMYLRKVSASGRIRLPRVWVDILHESRSYELYLVHAGDHLLLIPVTPRSAALSELGPPFDRVIVATLPILGGMVHVPPDSLRHVGIADQAKLIGAIDCAQLWPPHSAPQPASPELIAAMKQLGF
jgi:hypothetical protein